MPKQFFSSPVFPSKWKQQVVLLGLDGPAGVGGTCFALPSALGRAFAVKGRPKTKWGKLKYNG